VRIGYALSSEEVGPRELVRNARRAEEAGFEFASISDHFHPWIDNQGQSSFVWSALGGIAHATERLMVGTGVTCPMIRTHPAIIAQAAATTADMMPGRFYLGVGTGEALNEHIFADRWPSADERRDMLEEAIEVIRKLWTGGLTSFYGSYYTVTDARIYTLPDQLPPIYVAASGSKSAQLAGRVGDGLITTAPRKELVDEFRRAGGDGKPVIGQVTVCWHADEAEARRRALHYWPTAVAPGELTQELPLPRHFEQLAQTATEEEIAKQIICGPDVQRHIDAIMEFVNAGFDHVYVHQVGPEQDEFFAAYAHEILPELRRVARAA